MSKLKVAMLGDSLSHNGGIVTVEKLILRYAPPEVEIQHIATHEAGSMAHRIKLFGQGLAAFLLRLLRERTDLVHIHLADGGSILRKVIIAVIALLFQKAILIHTNGPAFHITYSKLPKCIQQCLSWIFSRCHGFIVMSQSWKDFYVPNLGLDEKRVYILPNPIELPAEVPQRSNVDKVSVVFLGRIGQRKGAFDLIQAFAHLPSGLLDRSQLIMAGDGEIEKARELVEGLKLTNHVTFLGWINSEQRNHLLATANVFVLPSYNEALPLALLEAMAWGLPVITTDVGGISEFVTPDKNGLLVTPGNIQQISAAIQSLIENESLRLCLGNAARESIAPLNVDNFISSLMKIYYLTLNIKEGF